MQLISTNVLATPAGSLIRQDATTARFGLKYCPSMDLIAIYPYMIPSEGTVDAIEKAKGSSAERYSEDEDEVAIDVYRLNGQKVFTIAIESETSTIFVIDLSWRADGIIFAVTTSDNMVRLVNSFSGKIVHTHSCITNSHPIRPNSDIPTLPSPKRKSIEKDLLPGKRQCTPVLIKCSTHFSNPEDAKRQFDKATEGRDTIVDDLLSLNANISELLDVKANLPGELANVDIEQYLPKLSTLPPNGPGEEDVFSTRTSVDSIFHSTKKGLRSTNVDVVATAQNDGYIHVRIFDSFEVGDIDLNRATNTPTGTLFCETRHVATHPFSASLYLIVEEHCEPRSRLSRTPAKSARNLPSLHLISLNLQFLQEAGSCLPILATKATQLQNLVRYLQQIQAQMMRDVKSAFDLPSRFISNLDQDLQEQDGEGSIFETSAHNSLLTGHVHGKFKEWLADVLGERGIKRWEKAVSDCLDLIRRLVNENWNPAVERAGIIVSNLSGIAVGDDAFGIERRVLDHLRDVFDVMAIMGEDLLQDVNSEMAEFEAFMKWLKREVEMSGLEDTSEKLDEMREGSDHSDIKKIMRYISNGLRATAVKKYLYDEPDILQLEDEGGVALYNTFIKSRNANSERAAISLKSLTGTLTGLCDQLFQQVASRLRERVSIEYMCLLGDDLEADSVDARINWESEYPVLQVIGKHRMAETRLCWIRTTLDTGNKSNKVSVQNTTVDQDEKILDVKFIDDSEFLVLTTNNAQTRMISVNTREPHQHAVKHTFGGAQDKYIKAGLMPRKLEINGRKGRRTVTVLDENGRGYGVFDIDSWVDDNETGADG